MIKRLLSILISICLMVGLLPTAALAVEKTEVAIEFSDAGPQYTGEYVISTKESLEALAQAVNAGNTMQGIKFYLQNDIVLNDGQFFSIEENLYYTPNNTDTAYEVNIEDALYEKDKQLTVFVPIGFQAKQGDNQWEKNGFAGEFYGNSHEIKGLFVNGNTTNAAPHYKGLFGALLAGGKISNLTVSGCVYGTGSNTGGVVGKSWGCIDNCHFSGVVMGAFNVGGIIGETASIDQKGAVQNCISKAHISAASTATSGGNWGGIVGCANGVSIQSCINYGAITSSKFNNVGGIIGVGNADISTCINWGSVTGPEKGTAQGGIVGSHHTGTTNLNFICITTADELMKYTKLTRPNNTKCATALCLNGGTFERDIVISSGTLSSPIKENQIFGGWYANSDLVGDSEQALELEKIYYAKWVREITFNANGGDGDDTMNPQQIPEGDNSATLTPNTFTKTGYTFAGWNTAKDGSGDSYTDQSTAPTTSTTLYAQWKPNTYTIEFSANGGEGTMADISATYDTPVTLPGNGFNMTGKNFAGWDTDSSANEVIYSDESDVKNLTAEPNGAVTLYAVWTDKQILDPDLTDTVVTYNGQPQSFQVDDTYVVKYRRNREEVTEPTNAGVYDVEIFRAEDETFAAYHGYVMGGLVINKAPLTIKADDKSIRVSNTLPVYTYTVDGWQGNDASNATTLLAEVSTVCNDADANTVGSYIITVSGPQSIENYTIAYENGTLTVSRRSSSSGSSNYSVTANTASNGSVTVSKKYASKGATVTVTTKPDTGYELDKLTVTDKDGKEIKLTNKGSGEFTFEMPASKVTVKATFKKAGESGKNPFTDVSSKDYFYDAVLWAAEKGVTSGVTDTLFAPNASCTRAQMVTFLWRANGSPVVNYAMKFTDVPADAYYAEAVRWAVSKGITSGTTETTFSPDATVTRAQTVSFLYRAQ